VTKLCRDNVNAILGGGYAGFPSTIGRSTAWRSTSWCSTANTWACAEEKNNGFRTSERTHL